MQNPMTRDSLLGMISGPLIWAAHFLFCYVIVSLACAFDFSGAAFGIAAATLLAAALLLYGIRQNYRKWRAMQHAEHHENNGSGLPAFFALNAMLLCAISAVAMLWVAFPTVVLPTCAH